MYHRIKRARKKDSILFGVLAGISKHLDPEMDPLIIRLIFLLLWFFGGFLFLTIVYLVLAVILHKEDPPIPDPDDTEPLDGELFKEKE